MKPLVLAAAITLIGGMATAGAAEVVTVYKSPTCGCCTKWMEHLKQNGFQVQAREVADVSQARRLLGMPEQYGSCHSAKVGPYLVEGHVPAADIKRLLRDKPEALGLAVPGMPAGSPGMESKHPERYDTLLIGKDGNKRVFSRH